MDAAAGLCAEGAWASNRQIATRELIPLRPTPPTPPVDQRGHWIGRHCGPGDNDREPSSPPEQGWRRAVRTRQGRLTYVQVQSATWRYERERKPGGTIDAKFEASRLAKVIKKHLINALHNLTEGPGDEPPEDDEKKRWLARCSLDANATVELRDIERQSWNVARQIGRAKLSSCPIRINGVEVSLAL